MTRHGLNGYTDQVKRLGVWLATGAMTIAAVTWANTTFISAPLERNNGALVQRITEVDSSRVRDAREIRADLHEIKQLQLTVLALSANGVYTKADIDAMADDARRLHAAQESARVADRAELLAMIRELQKALANPPRF